MSDPFVHLRVHTAYSLSEGAIRLKQLVSFCKKDRMRAVAVTDSNNLFGALEFAKTVSGEGIQPIMGVTLLLQTVGEEARGNASKRKPDQLVLLAKNELGWKNLTKIVSDSYLAPSEEPGPMFSVDRLVGLSEGLIALTGGMHGTLNRLLVGQQHGAAKAWFERLQGLFDGRLYIELERHGLPEQRQAEPELVKMAAAYGLPLVATNQAYFADVEMHEAHDALICIDEGRYLSEGDRRRVTVNHRLKTGVEMAALFADLPEAIANTGQIARRCAVMADSLPPILPSFGGEEGRSEEEEFRRVAEEGLEWRLETYVFEPGMDGSQKEAVAKPYRERLAFELNTIIQMQFPGYFLIVSDFIRWAKEHDIPVGPGRGSGAGSLVAWAMQITDLDPLRYGLLFERFLNPERVSMPDFDVDFCQDRRDEVISYVQQRYGRDRVAQIITFGKLQARAVLRDVGRVLQMPYGQVDKICKLVPNNPAAPVTLEEAIAMEPLLRQAIAAEEQVQKLADLALKLEGLYRHASTHAAGVVIGDRPLDQLVALYRDPKSDMPVVQYSMKYAEMAGLVKFDFLGLKTLTVLQWAKRLVQKGHGVELDLLKLPEGDEKTYQLLGQGESVGVFQLESAGMRDTLRKLKPDSIEDIIALVSLYRPGPMDNIPTYIARKHGIEKPEYPHPMIEEILKETFGVIIYQEQVMQIAQVMGGYSLGQADLLRRAMGKKIKAEMDAQRETFVQGAKANGVKESKASEVFDLMAKFASYGFNKSHAAAYALIAYQTAYLKANYPVEFFTGLMALDAHNTDKLQVFRQDAARMGIDLLPPDINKSEANFSVEKLEDGRLAIRYALGALKNVGMAAMEGVVEARRADGPFKDMYDVARRLDGRVMNRRQMEFLIKAGVFDSLNENRRQLFEALDMLIAYSTRAWEEKTSSQHSLFSLTADAGNATATPPPSLPNVEDWARRERLGFEFDAVGFYLSTHPLESYLEVAERLHITFSNEFGDKLRAEYGDIKLAGIVLGRKVKLSPKGKFAFLTLSDPGGSYEVSVFNEQLLNDAWGILEEGQMVVVVAEGKMEESGPRLIAQSISSLDDAMARDPAVRSRKGLIRFGGQADPVAVRNLLPSPQMGREGNLRLEMLLGDQRRVVMLLPGHYLLTPAIAEQVQSIAGVEAMELS